MRILLLCHAFNSLSQALWVTLSERGHTLAVELDINDAVTREAVELFRPDVVIAPYLRRAVPEAVWRRLPCLIVHPGPEGDRGPSALDWAILEGQETWGVTVLQAEAEMDAGPIWASRTFAMRPGTKGSLYRAEVADGAVEAVLEALDKLASGTAPKPLTAVDPDGRGTWRPAMTQADRAIDWSRHTTADVLARLRAADGQPGVADSLFGTPCHLFDPEEEGLLGSGADPGSVIAARHGAVCRATVDGAVWIGRVKPAAAEGERSFKRAVDLAFPDAMAALPTPLPPADPSVPSRREIVWREEGGVGLLDFRFTNGAMGVDQCRRLRGALDHAAKRPVKVVVLRGGPDFWSNGMDLTAIEAARSPAEESWRTINAIDDVARALITLEDKVTISALRGNCGAGGVFLALGADEVWLRDGVVLNPHYRNMGNLHGSEYWTYVLPRRVGADTAERLTRDQRLPMGAAEALRLGLADAVLEQDRAAFDAAVLERAHALAADPALPARLADKRARRAADEAVRPLEAYRTEELKHMSLNFHGFDPSYHVARYHFVTKMPAARTPSPLTPHRRMVADGGRGG